MRNKTTCMYIYAGTSSTGWKHHCFMPPTVPDEFSLIYQNLLLAATLVQAFRLPFSSLTWAEPHILRK